MPRTLEDIGRIAVELHAAHSATVIAKFEYHESCAEYFEGQEKWDREDPEFHEATRVPYLAFHAARAVEYNVKRRLQSAIRGLNR